MNTKITRDISQAAKTLSDGDLVAIPTETVYGLAGNALDPLIVLKIFEAKQRPTFDPLIVHIGRSNDLSLYAENISPLAFQLAEHFWPGPLTLLLHKKNIIPDLVTSGLGTVAIRMPSHPVALSLLEKLEFPLAAPSANPFGYISPTTSLHVLQQLDGKIPLILDGGPCSVGVESTIIDCTSDQPRVLRAGGLAIEELMPVTGPMEIIRGSSRPEAPGMLETHYSPKKPLHLGNLKELLAIHASKKIGVLSFSEEFAARVLRILSAKGDLKEAAQNLFAFMRQLDASDCDVILAETVPDVGLGRAINDRLRRASLQ